MKGYYAYLNRVNNPFGAIKVKGEKFSIQLGVLSEEELLQLFLALPQDTALAIRAKVLASFYLFQGVTTTELLQLKISDLNWDLGTLDIPKTKLSNPRTLPLQPAQLRLLLKVVDDSRFLLTDLLFQCLGEGKQDKWVVKHLHLQLKAKTGYQSLRHVRYCVIMNWLQTDNLRVVQYKAGHRYISSTEKYLQSDISALRNAVELLHPLNG